MWFFSKEHKLLKESARLFSLKHLAPRIQQLDCDEKMNREAFYQMGELGFLGVTVPEEDGGSEMGAVAATIIMEEMSAVDASTTLSYLAHTILCVHQIAKNGSKQQKEKYLPNLLSGKFLGGMGLSEPDSGSDALGMKTRAELMTHKKKQGYLLNGSKTWITNGPEGDIFYCYAKTGAGKKNVSTFIIERTLPGFSTGKKFFKNGNASIPNR